MIKFQDWFDTKLIVTPYVSNNENDANALPDGVNPEIIINVSDEIRMDFVSFCASKGKIYFWFPMNERKKDIGLNSIYGAMNVLYHAEIGNKTIALHCHSGINRSRIVWACYYYMRTGTHLEDIKSGYLNKIYRASARGYLPPMAEMEKFLKYIHKVLTDKMEPGSTLRDRTLDACKIESINNF